MSAINKNSRVNIQWREAKKAQFTPSVLETWREKASINWNGSSYIGSNIKGKYVQSFQLFKNNELILSLDRDKNEMRYFRFADCGDLLCIFGTRMNNLRKFIGSKNPDIDVVVILWPSSKRLILSNPCKGRQVENFDLDQLNEKEFLIKVSCSDWAVRAYKIPKYYQGKFDLYQY